MLTGPAPVSEHREKNTNSGDQIITKELPDDDQNGKVHSAVENPQYASGGIKFNVKGCLSMLLFLVIILLLALGVMAMVNPGLVGYLLSL